MRVREFAGGDFDSASKLLGATWHAEHGRQAYWQGADELCDHLSRSDVGFVVEDDGGSLLGVALYAGTSETPHNDTLRMHWLQQRTRLAAMAKALGIDARADVSLLNDEHENVQKGLEQAGVHKAGEVVLVIVSPQARGLGVGSALLQAGLSWLASQGAEVVCLVTDDACDWQFYEHLGMRRTLQGYATHDADFGLYVYEASVEELLHA